MQVWRVIANGPYIFQKIVDGKQVPKNMEEWTAAEDQKVEISYKVINYLLCVVNVEEFKKLSRCQSAKEIWKKLRITHEGTNEVKKTKTNNLDEEFDNFKMQEDETIEKMFDRLGKITHEYGCSL